MIATLKEFVTLLGGATVWPLAARPQQGERMPGVWRSLRERA